MEIRTPRQIQDISQRLLILGTRGEVEVFSLFNSARWSRDVVCRRAEITTRNLTLTPSSRALMPCAPEVTVTSPSTPHAGPPG